MRSSDEILKQAAADGSIDIAEWPRVLESMLQRLRDIVHNEFPLPPPPPPVHYRTSIDPEVVAATPPPHLPTTDPPEIHEDEDADVDMLLDAATNENEPLPPLSQSSTKENEAPRGTAASGRPPPLPAFEVNRALHSRQTTALTDRDPRTDNSPLPPDMFSLYTSSSRILEQDFASSPPHTIQRLAELVLEPRKHYRFLPAYLRAFDRVIAVSSPVTDFPLPTLQASLHGGGFLTNGDAGQTHGVGERDGLGSDESLGGALLTPIPWLHNTTLNTAAGGVVDAESVSPAFSGDNNGNAADEDAMDTSPTPTNGAGTGNGVNSGHGTVTSPTLSDQSDASSPGSFNGPSIEANLRDQGGVTQGELLRMEQEAGIVPVSQTPPRRKLLAGGAVAVGREPKPVTPSTSNAAIDSVPAVIAQDEQVIPHARGPKDIGMEDMGPQQTPVGQAHGHLDLEAAVQRRASPAYSPPPTTHHPDGTETRSGEEPDLPGRPGRDPADVEKDVARLRAAMDAEQADEARERGEILADADGRPVSAGEQNVPDSKGSAPMGDKDGPDSTSASGL